MSYGFPSVAWASDCDVLRIEARSDVLTIEMVIFNYLGSEVFRTSGTYSAVNGVVEIVGLQDLFNRYCLLDVDHQQSMLWDGVDPWIKFKYTVLEEDSSWETQIYYNRRRMTEQPAPYGLWAVQDRRRMITPDMAGSLYFDCSSGLSPKIGLAYIDESGNIQYKETVVGYTNDQGQWYRIDSSVNGAVSSVLGNLSDVSRVLYVDYMLQNGDILKDRVRMTVDYQDRHPQSEIVFLNMFGVYETVLLTGKDTEAMGLEASFGYANNKYVRIDADSEIEHELNSGWLSAEKYATILDMCSSPWCAIRSKNGSWREIVIVEVEAERSRPSNTPDNVALRYRFADKVGQMTSLIVPDTGEQGVFDSTFDRIFD